MLPLARPHPSCFSSGSVCLGQPGWRRVQALPSCPGPRAWPWGWHSTWEPGEVQRGGGTAQELLGQGLWQTR